MIDGVSASEPSTESPVVQPVAESLKVLVPSPLGTIGLEACGGKVTSLRIMPERKERRTYKPLKNAGRSEFLDEALGRLSEYFAGARRSPDLEYELDGFDELSLQVFAETSRIPYGSTRSYQKLAAAIGRSDSYRLVRSILMTNPVPVLIPCHRVIPRKGGAGSYIAGTRKKEWLLKLESKGVQSS